MSTEELMELGLSQEQAELAFAAFEETIQETTRAMEAEFAAALRDRRVDSALRLALADAHDVGLAAGLIDRGALAVAEDGSITGLEEQVDALRAAKPFLFRAAAAPGFTLGAPPTAGVSAAYGGSLSLREVIAGRVGTQRG